MIRVLVLFALLLSCSVASAHPLAPSSLRLVEHADGTIEQRFRTPSVRVIGGDVTPELPAGCRVLSTPSAAAVDTADAWEVVTRMVCAGGLSGKTVAIRALGNTSTDVVWQVTLADGTSAQGLLHGVRDRFEVPGTRRRANAFAEYVGLGAVHLVTGLDHVLFVLSLLFVLSGRRALILAVTAFTVGHSASLGLASYGLVRLPRAPVEIAIALSLLFLATTLAQGAGKAGMGLIARWPVLLPALFGLVHGLGFATVLVDAGLSPAETPMALFGFNVGIELAQLGVLAAGVALGSSFRKLGSFPLQGRVVAAYGVGSIAAMWVIERGLQFMI